MPPPTTSSAASTSPTAPTTSCCKLAGRKPQIVNNMGYSQLLRGNKKKARALLLEAKTGMADTTVVDANLALLKKG